MDPTHEKYMRIAIEQGLTGMELGEGGPFGAVVVRQGEIISAGNNRVLVDNDPTAHAEIVAIRNACNKLRTFQLSDCTIYSSCEPCPMCLGAIYWARPKALYFACTRLDAMSIGFDDDFIYRELNLPLSDRKIPTFQIERALGLQLFERYKSWPDRQWY